MNFFLVLNWLGDSLDGTLARVRDQQRPRYGFYVDHMADTFGALALMAGLACSGYVHWQMSAGMLVCFYVLSIESYLATYTMGHFHLSHGIFGPTEIRILLAVGNVVLLVHPYADIAGRRFLLFDVGRRCGHCRNGIHGRRSRNSAHRRAVPGGRAAMTGAGRLLARLGKFNLVGLLGAALQLLLLYVLTKCFHISAIAATPMAVEIVVLHNFAWHERFTWRDRPLNSIRQRIARLWRFHVGNGLISVLGNTALAYCLVERLKAPVVPSAMGAIVICSLINFFVADRWVYTTP